MILLDHAYINISLLSISIVLNLQYKFGNLVNFTILLSRLTFHLSS